MLKIGEFSKLSHITVKALRFYEKEGILLPAYTDECTGYRYYETDQLGDAAKVKSYRQLDLSIYEIKVILSGADARTILSEKANLLRNEKENIDILLSVIDHILEENEMKYQVTVKDIKPCTVFYAETVMKDFSEAMQFIPMVGEECAKLNPDFKCDEFCYSFCEYLDDEYRDHDIRIRYNEEVERKGNESDLIKFRDIPGTKVLSVYHKGPYDTLGEAYSFIFKYAEDNGYKVAGHVRECYIDGIWNKESPDEWLTEVQLPIE